MCCVAVQSWPFPTFPPAWGGLAQNGKQKTPKWLADLLGVEVPEEENTMTLKDLFGKKYD